jgi:hypothetical protein
VKLKKLIPLLKDDFLVCDLDEGLTWTVDSHFATEDNSTVSNQLEKKIISVSSFYDQVLVRVKL